MASPFSERPATHTSTEPESKLGKRKGIDLTSAGSAGKKPKVNDVAPKHVEFEFLCLPQAITTLKTAAAALGDVCTTFKVCKDEEGSSWLKFQEFDAEHSCCVRFKVSVTEIILGSDAGETPEIKLRLMEVMNAIKGASRGNVKLQISFDVGGDTLTGYCSSASGMWSQDFKLLVSADAPDDGMNVSELPSMTSEKNILMPATSLNEIVSDCAKRNVEASITCFDVGYPYL